MSEIAIICPDPTDPVQQYVTACVVRALDDDTTGPPDDDEAQRLWETAEANAQAARAALSPSGEK